MDINILLALQAFREGAGACLTDFFLKMTFFGEFSTLIVFLAIIYWCIDKELGAYILMGWNFNRILNGLLKVVVCAYRPWIRCDKIIPNATAKITATGYSFPSGHSMNAGSVFSGLAFGAKDKIIKLACWVVLLLVAFSRIFLCVHTPQDVLVGVILAPLVMFGTYKLLEKYKDNRKFELWLVIITIIVNIALALFVANKSYPLDYDAQGKLLVDPAKMAKDTYNSIGFCLGFIVGWFIEKRYIKFEMCSTKEQAIRRAVVGVLLFYVVNLIICPGIRTLIDGTVGNLISRFLTLFFVTAIYPFLITKFSKKEKA